MKLLNERWTNISSKELQLIPTKKGAQVHTSPHCALMAEIDIMRVLITNDMLNQYLLLIVNANLVAAQKKSQLIFCY